MRKLQLVKTLVVDLCALSHHVERLKWHSEVNLCTEGASRANEFNSRKRHLSMSHHQETSRHGTDTHVGRCQFLVGCRLATPEDRQRRPAQRHEDHTDGCWHSHHDVWEVLLCQGKAQGCALHACSKIQEGLSAGSTMGSAPLAERIRTASGCPAGRRAMR